MSKFTFNIVLDRLRNESGDEEDASEESDENDEDYLNTTRSAIINWFFFSKMHKYCVEWWILNVHLISVA